MSKPKSEPVSEGGILARPGVIVPVEHYSAERKAEFLLSTATSAEDYRRAHKEVRELGLDPDAIAQGILVLLPGDYLKRNVPGR